MSKRQEMQRLIRAYMDETGEHEVDMHKVAIYAHEKGWPLPKPMSPFDLLAKQFTEAAGIKLNTTQTPEGHTAFIMQFRSRMGSSHFSSMSISTKPRAMRCGSHSLTDASRW